MPVETLLLMTLKNVLVNLRLYLKNSVLCMSFSNKYKGLKKWILLIKTLALAIQIATAKIIANAIVIITAIVTVIAIQTILVIVN